MGAMKQHLRKGNQCVYVSYHPYGNTDSLVARDFTLDADEKRVLFSMDFSASERIRNKDANLYIDAKALIENASKLKQFQISIEKWLNPLASALKEYRNASRELEIRFKDSPSHIYLFDLKADKHCLWFDVLEDAKLNSIGVH
jgi:hypothetical protein